jgi:hypothetical protein
VITVKESDTGLVGVAEAADILGVFRSNFVRDWATRPDFPEPVARLRCGPVWREADVRAFVEARIEPRLQ